MNKAIIVGEVSYPPQYNENQWGGVLNMLVKSTHRYKDNQGSIQERSQTLRVALWGKLAELYRGVSQGDTVALEGRIQNKKVQKKDGSEEWRTEIVAASFEIVVGAGIQESAPPVDGQAFTDAIKDEFTDDDIPF